MSDHDKPDLSVLPDWVQETVAFWRRGPDLPRGTTGDDFVRCAEYAAGLKTLLDAAKGGLPEDLLEPQRYSPTSAAGMMCCNPSGHYVRLQDYHRLQEVAVALAVCLSKPNEGEEDVRRM